MPRVRASSSAVSTRSEPSRWRWSSALGIASIRRRRAGAASGRCYRSGGGRGRRPSGVDRSEPPATVAMPMRPAREEPQRHVHHPRHRRQRLRRQPRRPGPAGRGSSGRRARPDADGRRAGPRPAAGRPARRGRDPDRRRHPPGHARRGAGRRRCRRPPRRDPARLQRRRRPAPGQHRGDPRRRRGHDARPASGGSSTWARWASRTTRTSTTRARRRRPRRSSAASGLDWTILKPSLQFGEGDGFFNIIAGLVRLSPGIVPVPGDGKRRFQPIHGDDVARSSSARLADPATIGGTFELGGPRYWTYREITREVLTALGKRRLIVPMPVPLIRLVAGHGELVRIAVPGRDRPAAPAPARQHRPARPHPDALRLRAAADGGRARLPARPGSATSVPPTGRDADRCRDRHRRRGLGALVWLIVVVAIALGAAGIVDRHGPRRRATPAGPTLTAAGDAEVTAACSTPPRRTSTALADQVEALGDAGARRARPPSTARDADRRASRHRRRATSWSRT